MYMHTLDTFPWQLCKIIHDFEWIGFSLKIKKSIEFQFIHLKLDS